MSQQDDVWRSLLKETCEHSTEYLSNLQHRHVFPNDEALAGLAVFDQALPETSTPASDVIKLLHTYGSPATVATNAARYFGFVIGGSQPVSTAANWLAASWDQVVVDEVTSPVGVKLESIAARWILELLGLPGGCSVGFTTGATMANFSGLATARSSLLHE